MSEEAIAIGFDFGICSIGVAIGQSVTGAAKPLTALKAKHGQPQWQLVQKIIDEWRPNILLVGDPKNMDDTVSKTAVRAAQFANQLKKKFSLPVVMVDERLSTQEARERLSAGGGYWKNKSSIDSLAAQVIVEQWLANYNN